MERRFVVLRSKLYVLLSVKILETNSIINGILAVSVAEEVILTFLSKKLRRQVFPAIPARFFLKNE